MWYEGAGTADRRFLQADERGSVVAVSDASGAAITINRYDEYGIPQYGNLGRFQYTGQTWYPELGMYNYKARIYSPTLGRFMQTDPIGYGDGLNWYSYVGNNPVNRTDPSGTCYFKYAIWSTVENGKRVSGMTNSSGWQGCSSKWGDGGLEALLELASWMNPSSRWGAVNAAEAPRRTAPPQSAKSIWDRAKDLYCSLPPLGVSGSAGGYRGLGAGVTFSATFDPQSGRLGISGGPNVGVGIGASVDGSISGTAGGGVPNGVTGSVGWNASVRVPGYRFGTGGTFIGSGGLTDPTPNAVSGGWAPGGGVTANANLTARGAVGGQVLPSC